MALDLPPQPSVTEKLAYMKLQSLCSKLDLLTDELYINDVLTTCDDPRYFVFEVR